MALPMTRHDIAHYLGIKLETVSRALSKLQGRRLLKVEGPRRRDIVVLLTPPRWPTWTNISRQQTLSIPPRRRVYFCSTRIRIASGVR